MHIRDARFNQIQLGVGSGDVDFDWMLDELKKRNYQGYYLVEFIDRIPPPINFCAEGTGETLVQQILEAKEFLRTHL